MCYLIDLEFLCVECVYDGFGGGVELLFVFVCDCLVYFVVVV